MAYEDVRDDKSETMWMLLEFDEATKADELRVTAKGTGDIEELKEKLSDDAPAFGYIRVPMANDELSQRTKFVLISWCGKNTKVMRRARLGIQKGELKRVIDSFSIEIPADDTDDLDAKEILLQLKKAGGANYDRQASDY
ncbi:hypothetical protein EV179_005473 [Coemansia sp. RSA 487]|nr:hypothetical protein IW138_005513 [Coemansia sp. RSA 986]KAJ2211431.1 hypothetical protein EV179_005473 [Coemansia sp. RSA 487]